VNAGLGILISLPLGAAVSLLAEEVVVGFDRPLYVAQLNVPFRVGVEVQSTAPVGFFSFGVRLIFSPQMGQVPNQDLIYTPADLDYNGVLGRGALRETGDGYAAVKGTVDVFADPIRYYSGRSLAEFVLNCVNPGDYQLRLEIFRTLGPAEQVFIDATGLALDEQLRFATAQVVVIPEPAAVTLFVVGLGLICLRGKWSKAHAGARQPGGASLLMRGRDRRHLAGRARSPLRAVNHCGHRKPRRAEDCAPYRRVVVHLSDSSVC